MTATTTTTTTTTVVVVVVVVVVVAKQGSLKSSTAVPPRAGGSGQPAVRPTTYRLSPDQSLPVVIAAGVGRLPRLRSATRRRLRPGLRRQ